MSGRFICKQAAWVGNDSNISSKNVFYAGEYASSTEFDKAVKIPVTGDVSDLVLTLKTDAVVKINLQMTDNIDETIYGTLKIYDENKEELVYEYFQLHTDDTSPVYKTFKLGSEMLNKKFYASCNSHTYSSKKMYDGTLYLNPDGTFVKTIDEATPFTAEGMNNITLTPADKSYFDEKLTGTIVTDGEYKCLDGKLEADIHFNPVDGGNSYSTTIYADEALKFTYVVPNDLSGKYEVEISPESGNDNLMSGWTYCTDNDGERKVITFENGKTDDDISFTVKTGHYIKGTVRLPQEATLYDSLSGALSTTGGKIFNPVFSKNKREIPFMLTISDGGGKLI